MSQPGEAKLSIIGQERGQMDQIQVNLFWRLRVKTVIIHRDHFITACLEILLANTVFGDCYSHLYEWF